MGVIYKLKPDIISFILDLKQKTPRISCRSLVNSIRGQFNLEVSKSSIHQVIKTANLSNPIGRPLGYRVERRFEIPAKKKQELFFSLESADFKKGAVPSPIAAQTPAAENNTASATIITTPEVRRKYDNLGYIFFKAAIRALSSKSFLTKIYGFLDGIDEDDTRFIEAALYFKNDLIQEINSIDDNISDARWFLSSINPIHEKMWLQSRWEKLSKIQKTYWDLKLGWSYLNTRATTLKIILNKHKEIFLNVEEFGYSFNDSKALKFLTPIEKAVEDLSQSFFGGRLIYIDARNSRSHINANDRDDIYDLICAFENISGQGIKELHLLDQAKNVLSEFNIVPLQKRHFAAILRPEFNSLAVQGESILYGDVTLRYIVIYNKLYLDSDAAILTNIPHTTQSSSAILEDISRKELLSHPSESNTSLNTITSLGDSIFENNESMLGFLEQIRWLNDQCTKLTLEVFCPSTNNILWNKSFLSTIFSLPGYVTQKSDGMEIELCIPDNFLIEPDYFQRLASIALKYLREENSKILAITATA